MPKTFGGGAEKGKERNCHHPDSRTSTLCYVLRRGGGCPNVRAGACGPEGGGRRYYFREGRLKKRKKRKNAPWVRGGKTQDPGSARWL